jgi:tRNA(Ile)-lysidine synthase
MKAVLLQFLSTISRYRMLEEGDRVLTAVSGGPDSVFLLHLLSRFRSKLALGDIIVAHVNYGKRGQDADMDQEFVEKLSAYLGLDVYVKKVAPTYFNRVRRENFQKTARDMRYRFFRHVAKKCKAQKIAVAHTLDDQAETVFMRFITGQGLKGLKGIPPKGDDGVIRPLIDISRKDIHAFLASESLGFRVDETNLAGLYERNRIRNEVFPLLRKVTGRDVQKKIRDTGKILKQIDDLVQDVTEKALRSAFSSKEKSLDVGSYSRSPEIVRKSLLQKIGYEFLGKELNWRVIEKADSLLIREVPSFSMNIPGGYILERSYDTATFMKKTAVADEPLELTIEAPGDYVVGSGREKITVSLREISDIKPVLKRIIRDNNTAAFDAGADLFPIKVKNFSEGDRIVPFGMKKGKKLKKVFIERKIPRETRRKLPVISIKDEIAWVPGVIRSALLPLGGNTKKIIVLEYKRN